MVLNREILYFEEMAGGLRLFTERTGEGAGEPVFSHDEELIHVQPSVAIALGNHSLEAPGTLYMTSRYCLSPFSLMNTPTYVTDL